ncbi:hypothetical protein [Bradyrhizobium japonicum]|uniref:hypothetical protein n=1 Tax=Bradyrhizobium japonicum TaxID=375 RepID=UPI0012FD48BC
MFALGFIECSLRLGDRSIATLALLGVLSEFAPARCVTLLPLPLEIDRGPADRFLADLRACGLLRLRSARVRMFDFLAGRQVGMLGEASVRSGGAPKHHARLRHRRGNGVGVVRLLRGALMKEVATRAQASSAAFIDGAEIARS